MKHINLRRAGFLLILAMLGGCQAANGVFEVRNFGARGDGQHLDTPAVDDLPIDNVKIDTNRDGMDIDCCRNVRVSNCTVNSPNDDAIVLKSSFGLGYTRDTENVTIANCAVSESYSAGSGPPIWNSNWDGSASSTRFPLIVPEPMSESAQELNLSDSFRRRAPVPPHLPVRGLDIACKARAIHQRRCPHPRTRHATQLGQSR